MLSAICSQIFFYLAIKNPHKCTVILIASSDMGILPSVKGRERTANTQPAVATAVLELKGSNLVKGRRKSRPLWCPGRHAEKALPRYQERKRSSHSQEGKTVSGHQGKRQLYERSVQWVTGQLASCLRYHTVSLKYV